MSNNAWEQHPSTALRVGRGFDISGFDRASTPGFNGDKRQAQELMQRQGQRLAELQKMLFAQAKSGGTASVLLVLQGMDTSGKGGIVRHVLGMVDPQGVHHRSFGVPTPEERSHHYLWRIEKALPVAGKIGVFDRSHYEDVLVVRVHNLVEGSPWQQRFNEINDFEARVAAAGTRIVKCALLVSPEEQLERLAERVEREDKRWKYNPKDLDERAHWQAYQDAYQEAMVATSTPVAPWFAIPADNKWFARLAITEILLEAMESLNLSWPPAHFDVELERARIAALRGAQAS